MRGRVVFVNRYFYPDHSATSQMLSDLAFYLANRGWKVTVLTSRQRYDEPRARLEARENVNGVEIIRLWTTRFGRSNLVLRAFDYATFYLSAFLDLLERAEPGVIVIAKTDPPMISVAAGWACALQRATLVNWIQDLFPEVAERLETLQPGLFTRVLRRFRDRSLRRAKMNVVIGRRMQDALAELGMRTRVRENWADDVAIQPMRDSKLRNDWELGTTFVVAYSGNLGRAHEFQTLIEAMRTLREEPRIRFLIIGAGPQLPLVQTIAREEQLQNVIFKPYQPREALGDVLAAGDVHLISLRPEVEGLIVPSKFYGIAAAGRPSIYIGDSGGEIARIVVENNCGIAVSTGDSPGLVDALRQLAADPERVAEMGRNARALFERDYAASVALPDWERILLEATA